MKILLILVLLLSAVFVGVNSAQAADEPTVHIDPLVLCANGIAISTAICSATGSEASVECTGSLIAATALCAPFITGDDLPTFKEKVVKIIK